MNSVKGSDNILELTGEGHELLLAKGTQRIIARFFNGMMGAAKPQLQLSQGFLSTTIEFGPPLVTSEGVTLVIEERIILEAA